MRILCSALLAFSLVISVAAQSKRGLIIIDTPHLQADLPKYLSSPVLEWVYNYSPEPPSPNPYGNLSFVPMLWGNQSSSTFLTTIKSGPHYDHILSFNEPDMPTNVGGSQLSVPDAVSIWQSQIQPLKSLGYKLGAPAVASTPTGTQWLAAFLSTCKTCSIDFLPTHFYGSPLALQSYLSALHSNYSTLPIWLTEFAFPGDDTGDTISALNETIAFCEGQDWVQRYAYFGTFREGEGNGYVGQNGAVWDSKGDITEVGKIWLGMETTPRTNGQSGVGRVVMGKGYIALGTLLGILLFI